MKPEAIAVFPNIRVWISSTLIEVHSASSLAVAISFFFVAHFAPEVYGPIVVRNCFLEGWNVFKLPSHRPL